MVLNDYDYDHVMLLEIQAPISFNQAHINNQTDGLRPARLYNPPSYSSYKCARTLFIIVFIDNIQRHGVTEIL